MKADSIVTAIGEAKGAGSAARLVKVLETEPVAMNNHVAGIEPKSLAANARLGEVDKVIDAYSTLMKAERKEVDAVITSATELTSAQTKKISKALEPHLGAGETVKLTTEVDPALLGGLTVQIGDKYLDLYAATKIAAIKAKKSQKSQLQFGGKKIGVKVSRSNWYRGSVWGPKMDPFGYGKWSHLGTEK